MSPLQLRFARASELLALRLSEGKDEDILKEVAIRLDVAETQHSDADLAELAVDFSQVEYDLLVSG